MSDASTRLRLALSNHRPAGPVLVVGAKAGDPLIPLDPAHTDIVESFAPDYHALSAAGWSTRLAPEGPYDLAIVRVPRARRAAQARIAMAASCLRPSAPLWIDGNKTDGVDSLLKEIRKLTDVPEVISKAHGKIFCCQAGAWVPGEWAETEMHPAPGFVTKAGVFSAQEIDPGSAALAAVLPDKLPTRIVDLGAGWGWLSSEILRRSGVEALHLVEADHLALACARNNINDARAQFHWSDARDFKLAEPVNGVIMNPPFHTGRSADPALGTAFISAAARLLTGAGRLWMVANRHLPYETALQQNFADVAEIGGDSRYKIITATGAGRKRTKR